MPPQPRIESTVRFDPEVHRRLRQAIVDRNFRSFQEAVDDALERWLQAEVAQQTLNIEADLYSRLKSAAKRDGSSVARVARQAMENYLQGEKGVLSEAEARTVSKLVKLLRSRKHGQVARVITAAIEAADQGD